MRINLNGFQLRAQFIRETVAQRALSPVNPKVPVPWSGAQPSILLEDRARYSILLPHIRLSIDRLHSLYHNLYDAPVLGPGHRVIRQGLDKRQLAEGLLLTKIVED